MTPYMSQRRETHLLLWQTWPFMYYIIIHFIDDCRVVAGGGGGLKLKKH